ncbi:hypothetical protein [Haloplanus litoreus]|uniref:Uncharacterized protein n=1 Tax=Haloplanus litoreus TaxID=767515 RepID=A0ABD6A425_9EURY
MTRRSEREIARTLDKLSGGDYPPATLEDVLTADVVEFVPNANTDSPVWRLDGEPKAVPRNVRADAMRVWLEGEPEHFDPKTLPDGALNHSPPRGGV